VVFVHGVLVNGDLWRGVVPGVAAAGFRCIAPDWPLGSHEIPMPNAELTPPGVASMIADFLDALDLQDVTLVGNDTGGALLQLLITSRADRVGRVVLTPCDTFEHFFPPIFAFMPIVARSRLAVWFLVQNVRLRALHRLPFTFGWLTKRPMPREAVDSYLLPSRRDRAIRHDLARFLRTVHKRHTLAAAERLPGFGKPVLLAWATEDRVFPVADAHRLEQVLPSATFAVSTTRTLSSPRTSPASSPT
jgi:pimeloyl-ACP methyl ester carboxylesterase